MAVFKCKMCGGDLEVQKGESIGTCSYCSSTMTLPKLDDEKRANLYGRANHYRRNNEFDKAMVIYENILNEDKTDAEAYWSLVLCKYGIEYVEDPKSHKRIPTCNRTLYTSIFADEDYKKALEYSEPNAKCLYEEEAKIIDGIQKGILEISSKEEPFDIFICYKETDNSGRRTPDSVLAQDIYFQLTHEGYKVFFSRITLEAVLGTAYEPYIFAALNSSKVMIAVGTKPEYFNSPWVKNEWSRFFGLIKSDSKKILIPAYKDMDPYDLPEEFSHLQSQDMSKLGFIQDLIRGIKKVINITNVEIKPEIIQVQSNINIESLLRRAFIFIEDGNFDKADELLEQILNNNPELSRAYLGKLLVRLKIREESMLSDGYTKLEVYDEYIKALRFSKDENQSFKLKEYNKIIEERIKQKELNQQKETRLLELQRIEKEKTRQEEIRKAKEKAKQDRPKQITIIVFIFLMFLSAFGYKVYQDTVENNKKLKAQNEFEEAWGGTWIFDDSFAKDELTITFEYNNGSPIFHQYVKSQDRDMKAEINSNYSLTKIEFILGSVNYTYDKISKDRIKITGINGNDIYINYLDRENR